MTEQSDIEHIKETLVRLEKMFDVGFDKNSIEHAKIYKVLFGNGEAGLDEKSRNHAKAIAELIKSTKKNTKFVDDKKTLIKIFGVIFSLLSGISFAGVLWLSKMIVNLSNMQ